MNRSKLKSYAPEARREFIQAVTDRAALYGLTATTIEPMTEEGDVAIIAGRAFPKAVGAKRRKLAERVGKLGFEQTIEAMAYTWFNRLVAIRYMELHGYLEHGYRVLSHGEGRAQPEIVEHAEHVDLPGLDREEVIRLKLDGTREEELYRMLLIAQCNALNRAMPFLFESIDDETELLLPDHLLHSDSLVRKLVQEIPEEDWQEVEIIGWLYQFYISEKKDEVIGKVVKSEDIPAATQLFTPNWIVKYLVQNSLGRQWVATYPNSPLKGQMEYYIEPAEQTPEVQAQLDEITPDSLNPEELTLLDPACGSGHILVEAYDLLKAIYQERGYRAKDIPRLILEKNLFGLEIDDRAAQLAAFALTMKARADDRSIFDRDAQPQVLSIQESKGLNAREITEALNQPILDEEPPPSGELFEEIADEKAPLFSKKVMGVKGGISQADVAQLIDLFEHGKTFGSLIQVPEGLAERLPAIIQRVEDVIANGGMFEQAAARSVRPLVEQARMLLKHYEAVVTNPPYMTSDNYNTRVKKYVSSSYSEAKADLCTCFIERAFSFSRPTGYVGQVTMQNWMFISRFADFRSQLLTERTLVAMSQLGPHAFPSIGGKVVQVVAFVAQPERRAHYQCTYLRLVEGTTEEKQAHFHTTTRHLRNSEFFTDIPAKPLLYWISSCIRDCLINGVQLGSFAEPRCGINTGHNARFVRQWHEVPFDSIGFLLKSRLAAFDSGCRWVPYNKGGKYRRWFGNCDSIVRFDRNYYDILANSGNKLPSREFYFKPSLTWSKIGDASFAIRCSDAGFLFDGGGSSAFPPDEWHWVLAGFLCSVVAHRIIKSLNPTVNFQSGDVAALPVLIEELRSHKGAIQRCVQEAVRIARIDWNLVETAWDFQSPPFLLHDRLTMQQSQEAANAEYAASFERMKALEIENNGHFIEAYRLKDELSPEVPDDQITLYRPNREEDIKRLTSYAVGCMMGRYSLDAPGLIYAHSGNEGFDPAKYQKFAADEDGIVPVTEFQWFEDDAAKRLEKFIATAWPDEHLQENLQFVAESLGPKRGESPRETIRRYLAAGFFKHHMKLYKKRPIYWLFSSGKHRGFQALVYLHRYNEGTLARMRTEYVVPLLGKIAARIDLLQGKPKDDKKDDKKDVDENSEIGQASSPGHQRRLRKERDILLKQRSELAAFDEKLRHYADGRITLDLDDGVKVNYAKFGNLLAEVKAITGKNPEQ